MNHIIIVDYRDEWPEQFRALGGRLRGALGSLVLRIDHIGSTSVPGLAAKPVIDVQVSVLSFEPITKLQNALASVGFVWRADNPDLTKRYFREVPGQPRTHIHVRRAGSWSEQLALLFRDYLRAHHAVAADYAQLKRQLAAQFRDDRSAYTAAKSPFIWQVLRQADEWAQLSGWVPAPSDC